MNSLEWRVKKLENKILGQSGSAHVDRILGLGSHQENILTQLDSIAKAYKNFMDIYGKNYERFVELYEKNKTLLNDTQSETSKVELVLAYEEDLTNHMKDLELLVNKADQVLNVEKWPDTSRLKLEELQRKTREQHLQSIKIDQRTEELINIYTDIIGSFKSNMSLWNDKLEHYAELDKKLDDDD